MTLSFRQQQILEIAQENARVSVDELVEQFNVTPQTIRKDLNELCEAKLLNRVHGGAMIASGVTNVGYTQRQSIAEAEKRGIGELCAKQIPNNASLFINIGTTTEAVAHYLVHHKNLLVITNNINVANTLINNPSCEVIIAGGVLRPTDGGIIGEATVDFIKQFKVDYAVIGASAIDEDGALLDYDYREVRVAQAIIENARQTILVADKIKFERSAPVRIAHLSQISTFVTDEPVSDKIARICAANDVKIHALSGKHD
ncbi:DeoR/GlpR family DNA-binding transcription regulator [Terasakiella pusilla]|uniref:DeoR/GlpR family DNA-binding transcription regulator n=1 Tax=Terasakiella pusilla TaxID=64973 RepID=UPI000491A183|nr:DeoR/GlpR family DNA-binding transcription regulator [Terasakiella pusilla]